MSTEWETSEIKKAKKEIDDFHEKQTKAVENFMNENEKYGQNIEVINIHNHFGGNQYYGTSERNGLIETMKSFGKVIIKNPLLTTAVSMGVTYAGSKLISKSNQLRIENAGPQTKIKKEEIKLLESKTAAQNVTVYANKSVFSTHGFTIEFNVEDEKDIVINIFSTSDSPTIENYLNKKGLNEVTFNNLPKDDSFVIMLKDVVKCKFHRLNFIEKEKSYNLYVNGDLQKSYKITFERKEGDE